MLQPWDKDFKITMINMLTDLVSNKENTQWTEGNCSKHGTNKKEATEMLEIKKYNKILEQPVNKKRI